MKAIYTGLLFIIAVVAFSGCVADNTDDCPDPDRNLVIHFEYFDEGGNDIFAERVDMVDVVIFDEYYNFYNWIYLPKQSLEQFQGVRTEVEPGQYHVLCWANISSSRNDIEGGSSLGSVINHYNPETADPLHYAPDMRQITSNAKKTRSALTDDGTWLLSVAATGTTEDTIAFMSAHRTLNVYLQNFPGMDDPDPVYPVVTVDHLADYYNLNLSKGPENRYFAQTSNEVDMEGERYCHVKFYIPHFDNDNNVNLEINVPEPYNISTSVSMQRILEINDIDSVYDGDDIILTVEIIWGDTYVEVKLPDFMVIDVEPEF